MLSRSESYLLVDLSMLHTQIYHAGPISSIGVYTEPEWRPRSHGLGQWLVAPHDPTLERSGDLGILVRSKVTLFLKMHLLEDKTEHITLRTDNTSFESCHLTTVHSPYPLDVIHLWPSLKEIEFLIVTWKWIWCNNTTFDVEPRAFRFSFHHLYNSYRFISLFLHCQLPIIFFSVYKKYK